MHRFLIRQAKTHDFADVRKLAYLLNSVNLPDKEEALYDVIDKSVKSFTGQLSPFACEYLFVLQDFHVNQIVGSSAVIAQHGTPELPHVFFDVKTVQHYSRTLDKGLMHSVLQIGFEHDGPTEIGRLVLLPKYRHMPEKLGRFLSFIRFCLMAMFKERFRDRVLAELLPPLLPEGKSALWEALGRHFTHLEYVEADHASRTNKEFIERLFPKEPIHMAFLSDEAKAVIGVVGQGNKGAKKLLESVGFSYSGRIDPFDGGPHYEAARDAILPISQTRAVIFERISDRLPSASRMIIQHAIIGVIQHPFTSSAEFRAVLGDCQMDASATIVFLHCETFDVLQIVPGQSGFMLDLDPLDFSLDA